MLRRVLAHSRGGNLGPGLSTAPSGTDVLLDSALQPRPKGTGPRQTRREDVGPASLGAAAALEADIAFIGFLQRPPCVKGAGSEADWGIVPHSPSAPPGHLPLHRGGFRWFHHQRSTRFR